VMLDLPMHLFEPSSAVPKRSVLFPLLLEHFRVLRPPENPFAPAEVVSTTGRRFKGPPRRIIFG